MFYYVDNKYLKNLFESKFTAREIDVITCISHGRSTKKIASLLSVSSKTIENHISNIYLKINCNSREGIIDFFEKESHINLLNLHYKSLTLNADFIHLLNDIKKSQTNKLAKVIIYADQKYERVDKVENHLRQAGW